MAYFLRFDGVNDYITLPTLVGGAFADRLDVNQEWTLEWKFKRSGSDSYVHRFFYDDGGSADNIIFRPSDGLFRVTLIAGLLQWSVTGVNSTDAATFRIVKTGGTNEFELFVDYDDGVGFVSKGVRTSSVQIYNFNWIGQVGGTGYINGDLYYVSYTTTNSGVNFYADPTASIGQGELVDTANGNNGTPIGFPTNFDDALIFYDDGSGSADQDVTSNETQQAAQSETQSVTCTKQAGSIESQQVIEADQQTILVTQSISSEQSQQLSQSEQKSASVTQLLSSLNSEQTSESTQQAVQLAQQIQHNEAQQNANADTQAVTISLAFQPIEVEQKAQAEQEIVQDGGGITANDAQQQSESEQQSITANQSVNSVEENQNVESVQANVTLAQQINAVEVDQFAQADQSVITDGNGILALQVDQKSQAQVLEVTQVQQVSPLNVEQQLEAEQALPTIIQRLLAVEAEQITQAPTLQVSDSDIIIDPQKISVERVTPTFTIQLVERPKYTIVRL